MNKCFRVSTLLVAALFVCLFGLMSGAQAQNRPVLSKHSLPPDLQNLPSHMLAKMPWLQPDRMKHPNLHQGFNSPRKIYQSWEQRPNSPLSQTKPLSKVTTESSTAQLTSSCLNEDWVARYSESDNSYDYARDIAVDGDGNVYVTGSTFGDDGEPDYLTVKYNAAGTLQWTARYNGSGNRSDEALAIAVDGSGNVYVTGGSTNSNFNSDYTTIKYSAAGVQLWEAHYDGPAQSHDGAAALVLDGSGNIYVTGGSYNSGGNLDYATIKYNNAGLQQWEARYNGSGNDDDFATELALDSNGNVYVAGSSENANGNNDYTTIKYNTNGVQQWEARYDGPGNDLDLLLALAVDGNNNVYVTGRSTSSLSYDFATIKYDTDSNEQWVQRYDGPGDANDTGTDLAIDGAGNVYVTGYSYSAGNGTFVTIKYNAAGVQQWLAVYDGAAGAADEAYAIALGGSGNVYVTGASASDYVVDYATVKYDAAGTQLCEARYDGPGNAEDEPAALVVDGNGNVYVTGYSFDLSDDFATIKYSQESSALTANAGEEQTVDCGQSVTLGGSPAGAGGATPLSFNWTASPPDPSLTSPTDENPTVSPTVTTTYTLTVTDANDATATDEVIITVADDQPPMITVVAPSGLWPPNHKYVTVAASQCVISVQDGCSGNMPVSGVKITQVTSDEPEDAKGNGDGNTVNDIVIAGDCKSVQLRSERQGGGNGRVYTIHLSVDDGNGNVGIATCLVTVPKSQNGDPAVDDGPVYTVTSNCSNGAAMLGKSFGDQVQEGLAIAMIPENYTLEQNYPNPFNPSTTISFALPEAGRVTLKVYSETGQLVATSVDREMNAGSYTVNWHSRTHVGAPIASGVYFYQLVVQRTNGEPAFTETRRMTLVK